MSYAHTDVFLLCFSMVNPTSFHNITKKWVPEIRSNNPTAPIILIGTQSDLLLDVNVLINLDRSNVKPVLSSRARSMAEKIRATEYIECSSLTQKNLKEAFDSAIFAAIKNKTRKTKKRRFSDRRTKAFSRCSWKKFFCFIWTPCDCRPCGLWTEPCYLFDSPTFTSITYSVCGHIALFPFFFNDLAYFQWDAKWGNKRHDWEHWANISSDYREDSGSFSHWPGTTVLFTLHLHVWFGSHSLRPLERIGRCELTLQCGEMKRSSSGRHRERKEKRPGLHVKLWICMVLCLLM